MTRHAYTAAVVWQSSDMTASYTTGPLHVTKAAAPLTYGQPQISEDPAFVAVQWFSGHITGLPQVALCACTAAVAAVTAACGFFCCGCL